MASFYRKFIKNFSSFAAPITDCLRKGSFVWGGKQQASFDDVKKRLSSNPVLKLQDFSIPFKVAVDASGLGIGGVLSQQGYLIEFFSEKLSDSRQNWNTYEHEFYAFVRTLKQWELYLLSKEFLLLIDHFSLKYLQTQKNISRMHVRWVLYIHRFDFVIKHQAGKENKVVDALSRKGLLISVLATEVTAFSHLPDLYEGDVDFSDVWFKCTNYLEVGDFHIVDRYLFKGEHLSVPHTSLREALLKETHSGFGRTSWPRQNF